MRSLFPERIGRLPFFALGAGLSVFKFALDWGVFALNGRHWTPLIYIHPVKAPLFHPAAGGWSLWFALWAVAVPFLVIGAALTLARLRDAALPQGLVAFFFVPFANLLFFATMSLVPGREPARVDARVEGRLEAHPVSGPTAFWVAATGGAVLFLGIMAVSIGAMGDYGLALFLGAPFLSGLAVARLLARLGPGPRPAYRAIGASLVAAALATAVMIAFAQEGLVCILMAAPLVVILAFLGAVVGSLAFQPPRAAVAGCFALLPMLAVMDHTVPVPERVVASEVVVNASPEAVWKQVIAFPPLPPTREWLFRAGVANPLRAEIKGSGVGAVRHCIFSTGAFVEPVTVWEPGRRLAFSVAAQPDVLRELTLWAGPRPPHLDDYLSCSRGEFILEPLPGGRTRLTGRTYYSLKMGPEAYWGLWSDAFIHRIHMRVLNHVAALAELDRG